MYVCMHMYVSPGECGAASITAGRWSEKRTWSYVESRAFANRLQQCSAKVLIDRFAPWPSRIVIWLARLA